MPTSYDRILDAQVMRGDDQRVRQVLHVGRYFRSEKSNPRLAAADYLVQIAETLQIPPLQLRNLHLRTSFTDPREQDVQFRLYEVKKFFASATFCYYQTIHNVPVWGGGVAVTVKENPLRVVHAASHAHHDLAVTLPPAERVARVRQGIAAVAAAGQRLAVAAVGEGVPPAGVSFASVFGAGQAEGGAAVPEWMARARITRALFYVYRYRAGQRQPDHTPADPRHPHPGEAGHHHPTLPLPPVPPEIEEGRHYLVTEIVFHLGGNERQRLSWKALVEVETGAILWLRAMTDGVHGLVFTYDPKTSTGNLANTPDSTNAVLNPLRDDVELLDLNLPMMGVQSLTGAHVTIVDDSVPAVAAPTQPTGSDFDYEARTNEFAAVNAYYHTNNVFRVIEDMGFDLATYFDGTTFPVHVDHRAHYQTPDGIEVNAFCNGDGPNGQSGDGIGLVGFCLSDDTGDDDINVNPLGRSVDKWVHWHELGGHGILWDHVNSANFGHVHSAGDALAALQNDPESQLRALPQRFQYAPFRFWPAGFDRWFNRTVAGGWGWGGAHDDGQYESEQILASTIFRIYQSLGGDAAEVPKRWHASRVGTWLVLNGVGHLSPGTNPQTPEELCAMLVNADADDWTSEGLAGGAYRKVIEWSFQKQGMGGGAPPEVDLYIDDGRGGEYPYQPVWWNNPSVWNRTNADGMVGEQPGVAGVPSSAYVRVKNRGTSNATGTVRVYHCKPGAGLTWPTDFEEVGPAGGISTGNVQANNGNQPIVGPFTWTPNVNMYGHDCLLAIVTTDEDRSNVESLEPGQTIAEWRLVPHDNNVGQRNVDLVPGGGGGEALHAGLNGAPFFVGNNFNRPATIEVRAEVPRLLAARGWTLQADGDGGRFVLKPGEKRLVRLRVGQGAPFTADELRTVKARSFEVGVYANGMQVGGMTYVADPEMAAPAGDRRHPHHPHHHGWLARLLRMLRALFGHKHG